MLMDAKRRIWWLQLKVLFCFLTMQSLSSSTLTTIRSSFEVNQQRYACMGEAVAVTCTTNNTSPTVQMSVNGRPFVFTDMMELFTGEGGASVALLSNVNGIRVLSVIIANITEKRYNLTCNTESYAVQAADLPTKPDLQGVMVTRTRESATLYLSWNTTSPANYDLEHFKIIVNDEVVKLVKNMSILVNVSVPESGMQLPVSISVVSKCGVSSETKSAQVTVEAYKETNPVVTDPSRQMSCQNCTVIVVILAVVIGFLLLIVVATISISIYVWYHRVNKEAKYANGGVSSMNLNRDSPDRPQ